MKKSGRSTVLLIILSIYCLLYIITFGVEVFDFYRSSESISLSNSLEVNSIVFALLLFLTGTIYSWFDEKIGGLIISVWHFIVWVFALFLWTEAGMVLVLAFPMLIVSALLIRNGIRRSNPVYSNKKAKWELSLKILLLNYTAIYLLIVLTDMFLALFSIELASNIGGFFTWEFSSFLGVVLLFSLILFLIAFKTTWHSKFNAGLMLIAWYFMILALTFKYDEFGNSGPWVIFGIPLLIQGILYIYYQTRISNRIF